MEIYERMKIAREHAGLQQREIAEKIGKTQQQYSEYEKGKRQFPATILKDFCAICNVSADYLLGLPKGLPYPD